MDDESEGRSWALMVLLPDFMRQDVWDEWWERLTLLDIEIAGVTACRVRPDQMARLYAANRSRLAEPGRIDGGWLGPQLLGLDMTMPVLLRSGIPSIELTAVLDRWKGSSSFAGRAAGELRSVSPLADRCQSLFHTPTDRADFTENVRVLFHGDVLAGLRGPLARPVHPGQLRDLRAHVAATDDPGPHDIVLRSLLRALTMLAVDAHLVPSPRAATAAGAVREARARAAGWRAPDLFDALRAELAALASAVDAVPLPEVGVTARDDLERSELSRLGHRRAELHAAARVLTDPALHGARAAHVVVDAFEANGLVLDDWERHRLSAGLVFSTPPGTGHVTGTERAPTGAVSRARRPGARVLVTGATGTVGARLVESLLGHPGVGSVVALTRSCRRIPAALAGADGVEWRETDLAGLAPGALARDGFSHVVHAAADVRWNLPLDAARAANVTTTGALLGALAGSRDCRLIHVSTAFVATGPDSGHRNTYEQTKAEAEALVLRADLPVTIVRPTLVVGDGETGAVSRPKGLYLLLRLMCAGRLPFLVGLPDAVIDIVSTDACAAAIVHAIDHDSCDGRILTVAEGPDACTLAEVLDHVVAASAAVDRPTELPTLVPPARWSRLLGPLLRSQATDRLEVRELAVVDVFAPYLQRLTPLDVPTCGQAPVPRPFREYAATVIGAQARRWPVRHRPAPTTAALEATA